MTSPPAGSFLDFFVLEASEYVEQIDGLLVRATPTGPDADSLQKIARALRGSATMAKLLSFAELASAVESVGRALRQGTLGWDQALQGAMTAAVDDLKILVRAARAWSAAEDDWARRRIAELGHYIQAPADAAPAGMASAAFFAAEAANIAAGVELLATRPDGRDAAMNVLRRVRALRGVAGVQDIPALGEVLEATESAVRPIEMGEPRLSEERLTLLRAAGELLRTIASGITIGQTVNTATPQYNSFLHALDGMLAQESGADRVIPIANLFFQDAGPHVVSASPNPPTTPQQRFRMEVVSLGEHLHQVIDEARAATDEIQREHARSELGRALRAIRATAASFGQMAVAQTVESYLERTGNLNVSALDAIANFATTISPATRPSRQMATPAAAPRVTVPRPVATAREETAAQPATHARVMPAMAAKRMSGPLGAVASSLDSTIAAFDALSSERMAEPVQTDDVMPVNALLYRGRAALDRAIELRNAIRQAGAPPSPETLEELYDLVELARVD